MTEKIKWMARNPETGKREQIDPELAELVTGETVTKLFFCRAAQAYVTVPGASLFTVTASGDLELMSE